MAAAYRLHPRKTSTRVTFDVSSYPLAEESTPRSRSASRPKQCSHSVCRPWHLAWKFLTARVAICRCTQTQRRNRTHRLLNGELQQSCQRRTTPLEALLRQKRAQQAVRKMWTLGTY